MTTLSLRIAEYVAKARFEDLPAGAVEMAKRSLLDAVGVSLGASGLGEGVQPFIDLALESGGAAEATLLGVGAKAPLLMAALANGAFAHALDFEDAHDEALVHPNAQVIPALLAVAEARGPVTGADFLTALAVGCDLVCRLKLATRRDPVDFGWYTPALLGSIGAAAAAAKLMHATPEQVVDALSLALGPAASSAEVKYSPRSHVRAVRDAFASHAGLLAARLALAGVQGFDEPLEGKAGLFALYAGGGYHEEALMSGLGSRFAGEFVSFKAWPACRGTHAFIEMALTMRERHNVRPDEIVDMTMIGGPIQHMLQEPREQRLRPRTAIDAKFSTPFTTALALLRGAPRLADYFPDKLADPAVLSLARRSRFEIVADRHGPMSWGRLQLRLEDGRILTEEIDDPLGHPSKPLSRSQLVSKFLECASYAQVPASADCLERTIDTVMNLERSDDVGGALFAEDTLQTVAPPRPIPKTHARQAGTPPIRSLWP
jgi:2-methylcitrate dehydratase PrpD